MVASHIQIGADMTVGCLPVPRMDGKHFGVMHVDAQDRVRNFVEKPSNPPPMPDDPHRCLASMGIYVFTAGFLYEQLCQDATRPDSHHDFGTDIIPPLLETHRIFTHRFRDRNNKAEAYWRDV